MLVSCGLSPLVGFDGSGSEARDRRDKGYNFGDRPTLVPASGSWQSFSCLWKIFHRGEASVQRAVCCYNMVMAVILMDFGDEWMAVE